MKKNGSIRGVVNNITLTSQSGIFDITDANYATQNLLWPLSGYQLHYLAVGGGGGASGGLNAVNFGAGAAAGVARSGNITTRVGTSYSIVIGAGGAGGSNGSSGSNTTISSSSLSVVATAGQGSPGPSTSGSNNNDYSGGSGGWTTYGAGGGAGAGGNGGPNGTGGAGYTWPINQTLYGGGGGGGPSAAGGPGGGGPGAAGNGTQNTGSGAGGGGAGGPYGNGGDGVVIMAYPGSVQRALGGTVTISNNVVYHKFTSPGTFSA